ncbi:hypothetical protein KJ733_00225 [Patescibacteria group bacterium]|nr:hypothetical protein [Patescibacteria group bacterium]MBU1951324.1 hypothetical protein [Patescibacteria group bacterium]
MKEIIKTISRKEKRLIILLSVFVVVITFLPYIFGYLRTPEESFYTGIHALTPGDTNVYYSYLEQVEQGDVVFKDLYTSESQSVSLIKPFWATVGIFGKVLHLPHWLTLQITRSILIFVFIAFAYIFIAYIFSNKQHRKIAIILLLFSSGLGGLLSPFLEHLKYIGEGYYHWPMDLWVPESVTFLSMFHIPHILFSSILSLVVFLSLLISFETNRYKYSVVAGVAALIWFSFHPFHFFTLLAVVTAYLFLKGIMDRKIPFIYFKHFFITILIALPSVVYHFVIIAQDYLMAGRAEQNILYTPVWWLLIISYGFVGILAVVGVAKIFKKKDNKWLFVAVWFIVQTLLLYAPLAFQRRLSQNLHFPMVLLATLAVIYLANKYKNAKIIRYITDNKLVLIFVFTILIAFSNVYALVNDFLLYKNMTYPFFYLSDDYRGSFDWIKENIGEDGVILSEWIDGNFIPGYSGRTVYLGHGVETINYEFKQEQVSWLFQSNLELEAKQEFLMQNNINFIFFSDRSRELGDFDPANKKFLKEEFISDQVSIYRVIE